MAVAVTPPGHQPRWLAIDDVKSWLRLNAQDASDDDLISAAAAMAEPVAERSRPEWTVATRVVVTYPAVAVVADYAAGVTAIDLMTWLEDHPTAPDPGTNANTYTLVMAAGQAVEDIAGYFAGKPLRVLTAAA